MHKNDVIHRDIKPGNILITDEQRILLGDFGGAKIDSKFKTATTKTKDIFMGSKAYLSPEILENEENPEFSKASDIWALGILYHQMLSNNIKEKPFKKNMLSISKKIQNEVDIEIIKR